MMALALRQQSLFLQLIRLSSYTATVGDVYSYRLWLLWLFKKARDKADLRLTIAHVHR